MHENSIQNLRNYLINMDTRISIRLKPVGLPKCKITVGDYQRDFILDQDTWIDLIVSSSGQLKIEHHGKDDNDPTTAIIVEEIKFNELSDPKFIYQGVYHPRYPKHLIGNDIVLPHKNYLSWNGVWILDFTLPIYTWIHKTLNFGWIYD